MATLQRQGAVVAYAVTRPEGTDVAAPAVVFLHNIFCDRRIFDDAVAALRGRYCTIALDFRGHGESTAEAPYAVTDLAADVVAVLDAEGVECAALVGVSLGATVALETALAAPARITGLVLMGADAEPDGGFASLRNALFCRLVGLMGMRWFVLGGVLKTIFGAWFRAHAPLEFAAWRQRLRRMEPRLARLSMAAWIGRRALLGAARTLRIPARVVVGDDDVSCPLPCGEKLRAALPSADLIRIPHAGHTLPAERPVETTAAVRVFLDEKIGEGGHASAGDASR